MKMNATMLDEFKYLGQSKEDGKEYYSVVLNAAIEKADFKKLMDMPKSAPLELEIKEK